MYSEKLEKLIEFALADGVLTEKEKQALIKAAKAEGIDLDEFEMVLEAKLYEKTRQQTGNPVVDKIENPSGGFKQKLSDFKSTHPLLWKILPYLAIAVVVIFVVKVILSWLATAAIFLAVVAVLGFAVYVTLKIYGFK
jgi:hypothetical protein